MPLPRIQGENVIRALSTIEGGEAQEIVYISEREVKASFDVQKVEVVPGSGMRLVRGILRPYDDPNGQCQAIIRVYTKDSILTADITTFS